MDNLKVLLVDDEIEFVSTLAERLQIRGLHPEIAFDGSEALSKFNTSDFDIVILDILMPGISGFEVLKEIKKTNSEIPVILLTGHGATKDGMEGMSMGAYDYLMKPIDIEELVSKINAAVGMKT